MQAALGLLHKHCFDVIYWRNSSDTRLQAETVAGFMSNYSNILIVADNAESLLEDVDRLLRWPLHENGIYLHFLLASRDTDWVAEQDRLG
jgi:hypothetical protein